MSLVGQVFQIYKLLTPVKINSIKFLLEIRFKVFIR